MTVSIAPADMILFATVVREGGFTSAARQLGLSKQTVSQRIANLEQSLGVRLLERTTRRVRVTDLGGAYYQRCAAIAIQVEEANTEVQRRQAEPAGLLRVSAPVLYGRRYLAPVIADYLGRYPRARVELVLADRRVDLIDEGFDLAIRIGDLEHSSLRVRKLGEGHVYFVASPGYLDRHPLTDPRELAAARRIGIAPAETWELGKLRVKTEPALLVNDLEVAADAAIAGVGVARLPGIVCREAVRDGRLRVLFPEHAAPPRGVYALYPSREHLPVKVRVFLDLLAALIEPMLPLELARKPKRR